MWIGKNQGLFVFKIKSNFNNVVFIIPPFLYEQWRVNHWYHYWVWIRQGMFFMRKIYWGGSQTYHISLYSPAIMLKGNTLLIDVHCHIKANHLEKFLLDYNQFKDHIFLTFKNFYWMWKVKEKVDVKRVAQACCSPYKKVAKIIKVLGI